MPADAVWTDAYGNRTKPMDASHNVLYLNRNDFENCLILLKVLRFTFYNILFSLQEVQTLDLWTGKSCYFSI